MCVKKKQSSVKLFKDNEYLLLIYQAHNAAVSNRETYQNWCSKSQKSWVITNNHQGQTHKVPISGGEV